MGILNRTTDSFFDHGKYFPMDAFLARAEELVREGADILDVGGVRAGPGPAVSLDEELERVVPAIELLHERFDIALSVDTWNTRVLDEAMRAGAVLANDISGFSSPGYLEAVAKHAGGVVATHIRLAPRVADPDPVYDDVKRDVKDYLSERISWALSAGIGGESIVVDAGFDLGKTTPQSMQLLLATDHLVSLGFPILISASNKGFIGDVLNKAIDQRRAGSLWAAAIGAVKGAKIFRVHDVAGSRQVLDVVAAISYGSRPAWIDED